jgi:transcriptional regulator with GAF, ATPase, and Fis domain
MEPSLMSGSTGADQRSITVLDLGTPGHAGRATPERLRLIEKLIEHEPGARFVILASESNIPYALAASVNIGKGPLSVERIEWEHIQRVLVENGGNKTATARALKMHRRTLQRKLSRSAPAN